MSAAPHLTLISELLPITRRDFSIADPTLLNPVGTNPLLDGEWLTLNSSYQLVRTAGDLTVPSYQLFAERGRYDTQAIGKVPVLFIGGYEAETDIFLTTGLSVNSPLMVADVTVFGGVKKGLKLATSGKLIVGWVTRMVGSGADAKVRYRTSGSPIFMP